MKPAPSNLVAIATKPQPLIGEVRFTISEPERAQLVALRSELSRLIGHRESLVYDKRRELHKQAEASYQADPSDANFEALKSSYLDFVVLGTDSKLREQVMSVCDKIIGSRIIPLLKPIIQNALIVAGRELSKITDEERSRQETLIGPSPAFSSSSSAIVNAAKGVVDELSAMLQGLKSIGGHQRWQSGIIASVIDTLLRKSV